MGHTRIKRAMKMLVACAVSALIVGCEGTHIYNETHAKLATKVKDDYAKIDLLAIQKTEKSNLDKLLAAEISNSRAAFNYQRDLVLLNISEFGTKADTLKLPSNACAAPNAVADRVLLKEMLNKCYLQQRANALGAKTQAELADLAVLTAGLHRPRVAVEDIRDLMKEEGWADAPNCGAVPAALPADIAALLPQKSQNLTLLLSNLRRECTRLSRPMPAGELADTEVRIKNAEGELAKIKLEEKSVAAEIKSLAEQYQAAIKMRGKTAEERQKGIIEKLAKLRKSLDKGRSISEKIGVDGVIADDLYDAAGTLLQAAAGQAISPDKIAEDKDLAKAVLIAKATPHLAAEMGAAIDDYNAPPTAALLMSQRQAIIQRENISARTELMKQRVGLLRKKGAALQEEARLLNQATIYAEDYGRCGNDTCRDKALFLGLDALSRSIIVARAEAHEIEYRLSHVDNLEVVATNEYALKSWDNLIGPPIALLDGYHAAGIKPEAISDLVLKAMAVGTLGIIAVKAD